MNTKEKVIGGKLGKDDLPQQTAATAARKKEEQEMVEFVDQAVREITSSKPRNSTPVKDSGEERMKTPSLSPISNVGTWDSSEASR